MIGHRTQCLGFINCRLTGTLDSLGGDTKQSAMTGEPSAPKFSDRRESSAISSHPGAVRIANNIPAAKRRDAKRHMLGSLVNENEGVKPEPTQMASPGIVGAPEG